jgi:hypothetical protein
MLLLISTKQVHIGKIHGTISHYAVVLYQARDRHVTGCLNIHALLQSPFIYFFLFICKISVNFICWNPALWLFSIVFYAWSSTISSASAHISQRGTLVSVIKYVSSASVCTSHRTHLLSTPMGTMETRVSLTSPVTMATRVWLTYSFSRSNQGHYTRTTHAVPPKQCNHR